MLCAQIEIGSGYVWHCTHSMRGADLTGLQAAEGYKA
jgi:hypothetical protein